MALSAKTVTVAATPTLIGITQGDAQAGASLAIKVPAAGVTVFVGGPAVTAAGALQGYPLAAGESLFLDLDTGGAAQEKVYAIVATATQVINVLGRGV